MVLPSCQFQIFPTTSVFLHLRVRLLTPRSCIAKLNAAYFLAGGRLPTKRKQYTGERHIEFELYLVKRSRGHVTQRKLLAKTFANTSR